MAIKAGLVGVNPKGVDKNGMPINSGGANVEAEIQQINLDIAQLQASKVGIGQLTANNKAFHFAYDSTSEKYGYKLDGTGDFIPFESAGGAGLILTDPVTTGITLGTDCEILSGGYQDVNDVRYLDVTIKNNGASSVNYGFTAMTGTGGTAYPVTIYHDQSNPDPGAMPTLAQYLTYKTMTSSGGVNYQVNPGYTFRYVAIMKAPTT